MGDQLHEGIKSFLEKAKSRSLPLYLDTSTTTTTSSFPHCMDYECERETTWPMSTEYNPIEDEERLLQYHNASNEILLNSTCYKLDYDGSKYIDVGYSTYLHLDPVIRIWSDIDNSGVCANNQCNVLVCNHYDKNNVLLAVEEWGEFIKLKSYLLNGFFNRSIEIISIIDPGAEELFDDNNASIQNVIKSTDISNDLKIFYNWKYSEETSLSSRNFLKTITLMRDYRSCTLDKHDVYRIFSLTPLINYRLELMESCKLKQYFNHLVKRVVEQKTERNKEMSDDDGGIKDFETFEHLLNYENNINSQNVLSIMEILNHRPGFIMSCIMDFSM